jgi:transcriptional regulator with XRE-family HTH domain
MERNDTEKYEAIGKRIEMARKEEGLTQTELATKLHYESPTAISLIEAGKRKIKVAELEMIAEELHCDIQYLLTGSTNRPPATVRMALRSEHKDLSTTEIEKIESFINFVKNEQNGK